MYSNGVYGNMAHDVQVIAGNHDFLFEKHNDKARQLMTNCIYLQDEEVTVEGLR